MAGPYSIGSDVWPGLSKVVEESGELGQVIGKLMGTGGQVEHWDGSNLKAKLEEEIPDLMAALYFFTEVNALDWESMDARMKMKIDKFWEWHQAGDPAP